jgi:hypothetical protein
MARGASKRSPRGECINEYPHRTMFSQPAQGVSLASSESGSMKSNCAYRAFRRPRRLLHLRAPRFDSANAVCFETRKNLRCLSSDRRHAGIEGAVVPTEMCALSRPDLGSERGTHRAQSLPSVCDTRRDWRDEAAARSIVCMSDDNTFH